MINTTLSREVRIYNNICEYLDQRAKSEIKKILDEQFDKPDGKMQIEELPEQVGDILDEFDWHKEMIAQYMLFGELFPNVPEIKSYRSILPEYYTKMNELYSKQ